MVDLPRAVSDFLYAKTSLLNPGEQLHVINAKPVAKSNFKPVCKKSVAYIVSIILLNDKNEICLIEEAKQSCRGRWYLPAGRVEAGENLAEGAKREAKEETGYEIEPLALCCIEIDELALWFRFTFLAKIVGGSLKTHDQADSESLSAKWFNLELFRTKSFMASLRSLDFIKIVEIAVQYYEKSRTNSLMPRLSLSSSRLSLDTGFLSNLRHENNLIMPSVQSHSSIIFSYVILNQDLSHFLVYDPNENDVSTSRSTDMSHENAGSSSSSFKRLPSVVMVPDIYLKTKQHCFDFAVETILLPACFREPKRLQHKIRGALAVNYDGSKHSQGLPDGIQIVFLLSVFKARNVGDKHDTEMIENEMAEQIDELQPPYIWFPLSEPTINTDIREIFKKRLDNSLEFVTLNFNY